MNDTQPTPTGPAAEVWEQIGHLVAWLDASNGTGEQEKAMRLMKLGEEVGEVMQAYIGVTGQNPRKGVTATADEVADELCDVAVTALVALCSFTDQPAEHFAAKLARITDRLGIRDGRPTFRAWLGQPIPAADSLTGTDTTHSPSTTALARVAAKVSQAWTTADDLSPHLDYGWQRELLTVAHREYEAAFPSRPAQH